MLIIINPDFPLEKLADGIYQRHCMLEDWFRKSGDTWVIFPDIYSEYPEGETRFERFCNLINSGGTFYNPFGLCDGLEQFQSTDTFEFIRDSDRSYLITIGGQVSIDNNFKWHKHGPYIGRYRDDELYSEKIYQYNIYERTL